MLPGGGNNAFEVAFARDDRCAEINSRRTTFMPFLESFADAFRRRAIPSILIIRDDASAWGKVLGGDSWIS
jgi:hypothetical protein